MPELPEVETIVRDLRRLVRGAEIRRVEVLKPDLIAGDPAEFARALRGHRLEAIDRRAKNIVIRLDGDRLIINLGMTGRVLVEQSDAPLPPYLGVRLDLRDGRLLLYQDVRRFGRLEVISADEWAKRDADLGYEPLSKEFTPEALHQLAGKSRVAIKPWLMDQRRIVGVGNIYASESLFRARIDPKRPANTISAREAARLHQAIRDVLQEAIDFRGTTILDYRDAAGESGAFAARLKVYDREGEPCEKCGGKVKRIVQGGRSTFYCPRCQR